MRLIECDRCGKRQRGDIGPLATIRTYALSGHRGDELSLIGAKKADLCEACYDTIARAFTEPLPRLAE